MLEDLFDKVVLKAHKGYHTFVLPHLTQGKYSLRFLSGHEYHVVTLKVHKGEIWQGSQNFIMKKYLVKEVQRPSSMLKIREVKVDAKKVTVELADVQKGARVHVFASNFVPHDSNKMINAIQNLMHAGYYLKDLQSINLSTWRNAYWAEKPIGDESKYVLDRQELQEDRIGNALERPTLLLKRDFNRKTVES